MATEKVGVYRKYHGTVPRDETGMPLPRSEWPKKRPHRWSVRWFGQNDARYSKSFKTQKEAQRFAEQKQTEVRDGRGDPPAKVSLQDFAKEHERIMKDQVATASLTDQMRALRMFMNHVGHTRLMTDITPRHAESYVAARLSDGVKTATANKDIRTLKRIFNLAIDPRGYLTSGHNPFGKIKQRKMSSKPVRYVNTTELRAILEVDQNLWWRSFLATAYTTAARLGELLHLTWADVDFEQNRIRIVKKDADESLLKWEPKDHEGRLLPVPTEVMQLLADLQANTVEGCPFVYIPVWRWNHIRAARKAGTWNDNTLLLNNLHRRFRTRRKKAGVAQCTMHDLRRSCITNWARTVPIHVVQKLAGHSDIKTTQRYYLAVEEDDLAKARSVQSDVFRRASAGATDPKLTHSGQNGAVVKVNRKGPIA